MNKIIILIVITVVVIIAFKAAKDKLTVSKTIDINGAYVTMRYGDTFIRAKMAPETIESFWVNNGFEGKRSDGWFLVIPMDEAKSLKAKYGDFVHCDSPGAYTAQNSLQMLVLFTNDPHVREKIERIIKVALNSPIIEIKGSKLEIEEHLVKNEKYAQFDVSRPESYYLITDIRVTQEHYQ